MWTQYLVPVFCLVGTFLAVGYGEEVAKCDCCKDKLDLEVTCQTTDLPPYAAKGKVIKQPGKVPLGDCTKLCAMKETCVGINYNKDRTECELIVGEPVSFDFKPDWNFFFVEKDPETQKVFTKVLKLGKINGTTILEETTKFITEQTTENFEEEMTKMNKTRRTTKKPKMTVKSRLSNSILHEETEETSEFPTPDYTDLDDSITYETSKSTPGHETLNLVKGSTEMKMKTSQKSNKTMTSVTVTTDDATTEPINLGIVTESTTDGDETTIMDLKEKSPCQSVEKIVTNTGVKLSDLQSFLDDAIKITKRKIKLLSSMSSYIANMCAFLHQVASMSPPGTLGGAETYQKVTIFTESLNQFLNGKVNDTSQVVTKDLIEWKNEVESKRVKPVIDRLNIKRIDLAFKKVTDAIERKMRMMEGKFKNISKLAESLFTE